MKIWRLDCSLKGVARTFTVRVRYTDVLVSRIAARTLCDFSLRTASGPEGSSAK